MSWATYVVVANSVINDGISYGGCRHTRRETTRRRRWHPVQGWRTDDVSHCTDCRIEIAERSRHPF